MIIERLSKMIIPKDFARDIVKLSYAKNILNACFISIFAAPIFALVYFWMRDYSTVYAITAVELLLLSSLLIIKYIQSLFVANVIFVGALTGLFGWLTYHLGGIYSAPAYWLVLPPLIAVFIGGIRIAIFWCLVSLLTTVSLYVLGYINFHFPNTYITDALLLQCISICGLTMVMLALFYFYDLGIKSNLQKLHHLAYHDTLTGLPNKLAYEEILVRCIAKAKKNKSQFSILYIDIDQFHKINTIFGRNIGDWLLKEIVRRIKRYIRHTDAMARVGGNEFKIVIETTHDVESLDELANIIFMAIKIPYHIKEDEINITASIGIAVYSGNEREENLIDRYVDIALEKAKKLGGNHQQKFTESLANENAAEAEIEYHLSDAIRNNELSLEFQPQFDTKNTSKMTGLEALLRWNNKKLGIIPPSIFIPIAEKLGIISQFGEWILKEACQQYVVWLKAGYANNIPLAINISVHQLYNEKFLTSVEDIITKTGIPPHKLELELTETAIITDLPRAVSMLQNLSELGVHIVIDDFGAGYTSLSYLDQLPVSVLKIDKSLLDNLHMNTSRATIIESIIELAHKINLSVVVEGIESLEQLNYLRQIHCDYVQGYYLSKPLDVSSTQDLLISNSGQ